MNNADDEQRRAFRRAIAEDPDYLATKLIYADWLEERGYDGEAEVVRGSVKKQLLLRELVAERIFRGLPKIRPTRSVECDQ